MTTQSYRVAIVGAGFCGSMVAAHILRSSLRRDTEIILIDQKTERFGRGIPYSTFSSAHLLNVPTGAMGAFPDRPDHFHSWLTDKGEQHPAFGFLPRIRYGEYLESVLTESTQQASSNLKLERKTFTADRLTKEAGKFVLHNNAGEQIIADCVLIATGNLPQSLPSGGTELQQLGLLADPWTTDPFADLKSKEPVCVIGTGLTAIDVILDAIKRDLPNPIVAISRQGKFPQPHPVQPAPAIPSVLDESKLRTLKGLTTLFREHAKQRSWHSVIDSVRTDTQSVWSDLSEQEKRRFLRHLRRVWDSHRHRVPLHVSEQLTALTESGQLKVIAGTIKSVEEAQGKARVNFRRRKNSDLEAMDFARIVTCSGPGSSIAATSNKLVASLISENIFKQDPLGLGVMASKDLDSPDGLFVIGSLLKGVLWESTAVRELRSQAATVAANICKRIETST